MLTALTAAATKNASLTLCQQPVRDKTLQVELIALIGFGLALLAVVMRMVSRAVGEGTFWTNCGADDALILVAIVPVGGISACSVLREQPSPSAKRDKLTNGSH